MSCSWSVTAVALIILFSRGRKRGGRVKQRIHWGWIRMGTSRGPLCAPGQNKRKEPTWGGGGAAFWVGRGRGDGCGAQTESLRKRERKLEGYKPGWHRGRWISQLFLESSLLPDFKDTVDRSWVIKKKRANLVCLWACVYVCVGIPLPKIWSEICRKTKQNKIRINLFCTLQLKLAALFTLNQLFQSELSFHQHTVCLHIKQNVCKMQPIKLYLKCFFFLVLLLAKKP